MRIILFVVSLLLAGESLQASPQRPDYLIIELDTFPIYFLPLHQLPEPVLASFFSNLKADSDSYGFSFNLWRGYQAYWQMTDGKLYLIGLRNYKKSREILERTFQASFVDGKVFAYWVTGILAIGKSKVLKWDGIFSRTYFREEVLEFTEGVLTDKRLVDNYVRVRHGISRLDNNREHIVNLFYSRIKRLDWRKLSDCGCDDKYLISVNENGRVGDIELLPYTKNKDTAQMEIDDHRVCIEAFKKKLASLKFDIVRWNGRPYNEIYFLQIFYTVDGKLENWSR